MLIATSSAKVAAPVTPNVPDTSAFPLMSNSVATTLADTLSWVALKKALSWPPIAKFNWSALPRKSPVFVSPAKDNDGKLYQGFVAKSADKIFESTTIVS